MAVEYFLNFGIKGTFSSKSIVFAIIIINKPANITLVIAYILN